jgi:integrase
MLKSEKLSILEIAQIVEHTNSKMIIENYARYIKGEHLKISSSFNPFQINGDTRGDSRGDTKKTLSF